jgi:hypothetical protein
MYSAPRLKTTGIPQPEAPLGVYPPKSLQADSQCQCSDCSSDDCGANNPCSVTPEPDSGALSMIEFLRAQSLVSAEG